ncbi:MAG: nucleotidyltransferase domain-containing protein [Cyclobacteriaceae bacterium]
METLSPYIDQIKVICSDNGVKSLFAFGSVTTNKFNNSSDVDLVVEIEDKDPLAYSDKYFNLKFKLEEILKRPIDLLEFKAIRNPLLKEKIDSSKIQIYEG